MLCAISAYDVISKLPTSIDAHLLKPVSLFGYRTRSKRTQFEIVSVNEHKSGSSNVLQPKTGGFHNTSLMHQCLQTPT